MKCLLLSSWSTERAFCAREHKSLSFHYMHRHHDMIAADDKILQFLRTHKNFAEQYLDILLPCLSHSVEKIKISKISM